jgi:hypothetical protein
MACVDVVAACILARGRCIIGTAAGPIGKEA